MESIEQKKKRVRSIITKLRKKFPNPKPALNFSNPLELLIATILSAQCTDERVNMVTVTLFKKYRTAKEYAGADSGEIEEAIHSTGFYRQKTKSIQKCCAAIVDRFKGKIPNTMTDFISLDGVGRKTANVVLGNALGIPGIAVDTHVKRLSERIALSKNKNPERIEFDLMEMVPQKGWTEFSLLLINHGRQTCKARKPDCIKCEISAYCPSKDIFLK